ncbi:helix-turn-helix domain-containing protein [Streptomyces sp. NPDC005820]|uniref:TetR/AcrR family transcriptional regulator n=1 Tax=Streptomyces sp. NPDC005820 TaxID=3157069 RepID=UPI0033F40D98
MWGRANDQRIRNRGAAVFRFICSITRRAILDAAITLLATDPTASLSEVAAAAGVGRTTVHRYFPERSDLLAAIGVDRRRSRGRRRQAGGAAADLTPPSEGRP